MHVALVHDWLTGMRGGEKCLEVFCRIFPHADLFTLLHAPGKLSPTIERMNIRPSFLQRIPGIDRHYRYWLPIMPLAIESFDFRGYDLVVSLSHCVAKSVRVPVGVPHVCYCFTPVRYAWHMRDAYFGGNRDAGASWQVGLRGVVRAVTGAARDLLLADLRRWDRSTARRVTDFVAISQTVQERIRECYGRKSVVIYPPANVEFYTPAPRRREDFYLCVSAFAPYKRLDLAIEACNRMGRQLVIVGSGQAEAALRRMASPMTRFLGWQTDDQIRDLYRRCRALLFPGVEDFGIVPVEAQACGAPVIALGNGGATETIIAPGHALDPTGIFFSEQSVESLTSAIEAFESMRGRFHAQAARANAVQFSAERFHAELVRLLHDVSGADRTVPMERRHAA